MDRYVPPALRSPSAATAAAKGPSSSPPASEQPKMSNDGDNVTSTSAPPPTPTPNDPHYQQKKFEEENKEECRCQDSPRPTPPPPGAIDLNYSTGSGSSNSISNFRATPYHVLEIHKYFWPGYDASLSDYNSTTLHSCAATPSTLSYVLLFDGANPKWPSDQVIFVKSHLELLPPSLTKRAKLSKKENPALKQVETGEANEDEDDDDDEDLPLCSYLFPASPTLSEGEGGESHEATGSLSEKDDSGAAISGSKHESHDHDLAPKLETNEQPAKDPEISDANTTGPITIPISDTNGSSSSNGTSAETEPQRPIAMFQQLRRHNNKGFRFMGWYKMEQVEVLRPRSKQLVRMLELKWERRDRFGKITGQRKRDSEAWKKSLSYTWAVIKFARDEDANRQLGHPKIQRVPLGDIRDNSTRKRGFVGGQQQQQQQQQRRRLSSLSSSAPTKSVNELLREMRLEDTHSQSPKETKKEEPQVEELEHQQQQQKQKEQDTAEPEASLKENESIS